MPTSQNGYSAPIVPVPYQLPGGAVSLRAGAPGALLAWVAREFHARVEPLVWPGNWGYAYRDVRGSTDLSNHASGTAIDLNAPKHPLGTNPTANYTAAQITTIHQIIAQTQGAVRWGGDYVGRKDGMHFEIVASESRCAQVLTQLTTPTRTPKLLDGDSSMKLPVAMNTNIASISLPPQAKVRLVFSAQTTIFGGLITFYSAAPNKPLGTYPTGWRGEVKQGYQIDAPAGSTKAEITYSCASEVDVYIQAIV